MQITMECGTSESQIICNVTQDSAWCNEERRKLESPTGMSWKTDNYKNSSKPTYQHTNLFLSSASIPYYKFVLVIAGGFSWLLSPWGSWLPPSLLLPPINFLPPLLLGSHAPQPPLPPAILHKLGEDVYASRGFIFG